MNAIRFHAYEQPLQLDDVPVPVAGDGEVVIRIANVGVNGYDTKVRSGAFASTMPTTFPATPGLEGSGRVASLGAGVEGLSSGDPVYAKVRAGYAEYALANARDVVRKPDRVTFAEAAAVPVSIETAWSVLFDLAAVQPGQRVLIQGAAGSVGSVAIQLAKWKGAYVLATASAENAPFLRELGADDVIDYAAVSSGPVAQNVDVVFDAVGGAAQDKLFSSIRKGGVLISIVRPPSQDLAGEYGVRALARFGTTDPLTLQKTKHLVDEGVVRPTVRRVFPLAQANEAEALTASGHGRGKVVLSVWEP